MLLKEQAAKSNIMASVVNIQVFSIMHSSGRCGYYLHIMSDHAPMTGKALNLLDSKEMAYN